MASIQKVIENMTPNNLIGHKISYELFIDDIEIKTDEILQRTITSKQREKIIYLYIKVVNLEYRKRSAEKPLINPPTKNEN
eukprot:UN29119